MTENNFTDNYIRREELQSYIMPLYSLHYIEATKMDYEIGLHMSQEVFEMLEKGKNWASIKDRRNHKTFDSLLKTYAPKTYF